MSMRKWHSDVDVLDNEVVITVDITGIETKDLYLGISNTYNSLVLKYNDHVRDIPIGVKVKDDFEHSVNNGVLTVNIKRLTDDN